MALKDIDWMNEAACRGASTDIFFVEKGVSIQPALDICARCPVRAECLEYGLWENEGVYGGTVLNQRRIIRRERGGKLATRDHGTRGRYVSGCRCEPCTDADGAYVKGYGKRADTHGGRWAS